MGKRRTFEALANRAEFRQACRDGMSARALGRLFGVSKDQAHKAKRWLREQGVDIEAPPPAAGVEVDTRTIGDCLEVDARGQSLVMTLEDLIREARIDQKAWDIVSHRIKTWTTTMKGPDSLPRIVRNWGVTAQMQPRAAAMVDGMARTFRPLRRKPPKAGGAKHPTCLLIGDPQIGFRRRDRGGLEPMHDRRALDILLQIAALIQPDTIVCLGDTLDLAEWSTKFPRPLELRGTTQPSLEEAHWWLAAFRAACPSARIVTLEGNHDDRIIRNLTAQSPAAATLRAVGEEAPAMDMGRLMGLDRLDVEYVGPYPTGIWWHGVEIKHGTTVRARSGATVAAELASATHSAVMGHIHRAEYASRTIWGEDGPRSIFAASPGGTCRIGRGKVPGVNQQQNWQQAWALLVAPKGLPVHYESGLIDRGRALFRGLEIVAEDHTEQIGDDLGYPMVRDWLAPEERCE